MGMNVNPRDLSAKVDSTKVVLKGVPVEQNDSIWLKNKTKTKKSGKTNTPHKTEERQMSRAKGFARTALNAISNYLLPQGAPGLGEMLLPTEEEILEDILLNKIPNNQKLTPEEQAIYDKHYRRA